jgi:hypothetical protein
MLRSEALKYRKHIEAAAQSLNDESALEVSNLYPAWNSNGVEYITGFRVRYEGILYKVLQNHTSQPDWTPEDSPSLFAKVLIEDPNVIAAWEQPESTNPYMKGDKVSHNDKTWISDVDNNVWEPGVYGWSELTE